MYRSVTNRVYKFSCVRQDSNTKADKSVSLNISSQVFFPNYYQYPDAFNINFSKCKKTFQHSGCKTTFSVRFMYISLCRCINNPSVLFICILIFYQFAEKGHRSGHVALHKCCWGGTWYVELDKEEMKTKLGIFYVNQSPIVFSNIYLYLHFERFTLVRINF